MVCRQSVKCSQRGSPDVPQTLGLTWACEKGCDVDQFYNWDPSTYVTGVTDANVIGVEGALWSETITNLSEAEYMVFPRLLALAELGWSPKANRTATSGAYQDFLIRLAAQGARLTAGGTNFYPSPEVPWPLEAIAAHPTNKGHGIRGTEESAERWRRCPRPASRRAPVTVPVTVRNHR